jgi:glucose/arabinose dehydrogenase
MGSEQHLIDLQWCHQYPSHSIGALAFGADGALYVSGGDGASFTFEDYGQDGSPLNPCADPPAGLGGKEKKPTAEGGALRSQDVRTSSDPATLDGAVLRVDPATGAGMPDNPMAGSADANTRRIVAYGLRNPFRFTIRPGTNDLWIGDVGWNTWEEIDRVPAPTASPVKDFGWPCYENLDRPYTGLNICNGWTQDPPYFAYNHNAQVVPGESCPSGSASISGMAFYEGASYPSPYDGALFFGDFSRNCIWAMMPGADGLPDPSNVQTFVADAPGPVALLAGPNGDIFYVSFEEQGAIHRITYTSGDQNPVAVATADPTSGPAPLSVTFDGTGSYDPDAGDSLSYAWDLDGDGQYDDATTAQPTFDYEVGGVYEAGLQVSDGRGGVGTTSVEITVGNSPPSPVIDAPDGSLTWVVGQPISFSGHATDPEDGELPATALTWTLIIDHCPSTCHQHVVQTWEGVAGGSFNAPDHDYPSHLELQLEATDSGGLHTIAVVELYPQTVNLTFKSVPKGLKLGANAFKTKTPKTLTFIRGGKVSLTAPSPQNGGGKRWVFVSWSDGGARSHDVTASAPATYTATYQARSAAGPRSQSAPRRV